MVKTRASGCGCPICAGRMLLPGENDLLTTHPPLAAEWHPKKNGTLTPRDLSAGTRRKVWWRCKKGHEWYASVASRANGTGCPVCAGKQVIPGESDLASRFPVIAAEWHPHKKRPADTAAAFTVQQPPCVVAMCAGARVAGRCGRTRKAGSGCPYCTNRKVLAGFNDLATVQPGIAAEWHPALNGTLTPEMVTPNSHQKVWWQCGSGHVWQAAVYSRTGPQKCGCPVCAGRVNKKRMERYAAMMASAALHNNTHDKKG